MAKPRITIAVSHYDRHVPFFDGAVQTDGIDLNVLIVGQSDRQRDGEDRHERMLQNGEFDVADAANLLGLSRKGLFLKRRRWGLVGRSD